MKKRSITIDEWVKALRSGEYKQGEETLYEDGKYCCLGVACVLAGYEKKDIADYSFPNEVDGVRTTCEDSKRLFGMKLNYSLETLSEINDGSSLGHGEISYRKHSFKEIADVLTSMMRPKQGG